MNIHKICHVGALCGLALFGCSDSGGSSGEDGTLLGGGVDVGIDTTESTDSEQPRDTEGTTPDTNAPDTTLEMDTALADTEEPDTAESDTAEPDMGSPCTSDEDCFDMNQDSCLRGICLATGCSMEAVADATSCSTGDACWQGEVCQSGTCQGGEPVAVMCGEQECGEDACGNPCGICAPNVEICVEGQCEPQTACGDVPVTGCCAGPSLVRTCADASLDAVNCGADEVCTWLSSEGVYGCGEEMEESSEELPYACPGEPCAGSCEDVECGVMCGVACADCPMDQYCTQNACQPCETTCESGELRCEDGATRMCVEDARGCFDFSAPVACPSGFCEANRCGACDDACPNTDATTCEGGMLTRCAPDALGCLEWGDEEPCADGFCADEVACGVCDCPGPQEVCDGDGACVCIPDCDPEAACGGLDGCDGTCPVGVCDGDATCVDGSCVCSSDLCDGVCCGSSEACVAGACCALMCEEGQQCGLDAACGAACGYCTNASCDADNQCADYTEWTGYYVAPSRSYAMWGSGPGHLLTSEGTQYVDGQWRLGDATHVESEVVGMHGQGLADMWAVSDDTVERNTGAGWRDITSDLPPLPRRFSDYTAVFTTLGRTVVVGEDGYAVMYQGEVWSELETGTSEDLTGVWIDAEGLTWIVGLAGTLLRVDGLTVTDASGSINDDMHSVWGSGSDNVWVVGERGLLLRYDGEQWRRYTATPTLKTLRVVHGSAPDNVWAAGEDGVILHFDGELWRPFFERALEDLLGDDFFYAWVNAEDEVWFSTRYGKLHHVDGHGIAPVSAAGLNLGTRIGGVWGASLNDVWMVGNSGQLQRWDGQGSWRLYVSPNEEHLNAVMGDGAGQAWAVGDNATVLHFDGQDWSEMPAGINAVHNLETLWVVDSTEVWVAGGNGEYAEQQGVVWQFKDGTWTDHSAAAPDEVVLGIYAANSENVRTIGMSSVRHYDGESWEHERDSPAYYSSLHGAAMWGSGPDNIWITAWVNGGSGGTLRYDGESWQGVPLGRCNENNFNAIHGTGPDDVWLVGYYSGGCHWDGEQTQPYRIYESGPHNNMLGVWSGGDGTAWTVTADGEQWHFDGIRWDETPEGDHPRWARLSDVWGTGATTWAVGNDGTILEHDDNTDAWTRIIPTLTTRNLVSIHGCGPGQVWAVGYDSILHQDGTRWTRDDANGLAVGSLSDVNCTDEDVVRVVGPDGLLLKREGGTWSRVELGTDQNLAAIHAIAPDDIWIAGSQNTLIHYDGQNWDPVLYLDTDENVTLRSVCGASSNDAWAGTSSNLHFQFDGEEWLPIEGPQNVVDVWCSGSQEVWAVGGNDLVHYNGQSWNPLSPVIGAVFAPAAVWGRDVRNVWVVGYRTIMRRR